MANRMCWVVKPKVLNDPKWQSCCSQLTNFENENTDSWTYILEQPNTRVTQTPTAVEANDKENCSDIATCGKATDTPKRKSLDGDGRLSDKTPKTPAPHSLITKFTKVMTAEERQKQMARLREKSINEELAKNSSRAAQVQQKMAEVTKELIEHNSKFVCPI